VIGDCYNKQARGGWLPSMSKAINLQDVFLNHARKERIVVTIFLTNGFQFKGVIKGFDGYTVILDSDGKQQLVFKHAISTIVPAKPVPILESEQN
jgi:host factor-I protein